VKLSGTDIKYIIIIALLGIFVYLNSLSGEFIWDDISLIKNNSYIKDFSNAPKVFTETIGAGAGIEHRFYRPVQAFTYMLDYFLWGLDTTGYHITNVFLHVSVAVALYWLILLLFGDRLLSFCTSLLFVASPVHTEAVSYISGRADLLAALFLFLSFVYYIKCTGKRLLIIPVMLFYALALFSRESVLILPLIILLYHYAFKKKIQLDTFGPVLGLSLGYVIARYTALCGLLPHLISTTTAAQRVPGFFVAVTNYMRILLLPFNLHMEYGNNLYSFGDPKALAGVCVISLLLIYAVRKNKNNTLMFFSISWFLVTLLPSSNIYPINAFMAEHWLYLPSVGFFLVIAKGITYLFKKEKLRIYAIALSVFLVGTYAFLTAKQNTYWKEPIRFYERTLKYAPDSLRVYNNLGIAYKEMGKNEEAVRAFGKASEIDPDDPDVYNNLGNAYANLGVGEEAISAYKKAIQLKPDFSDAYNNLGIVYYNTGRMGEAITLFEEAIKKNPLFAGAYNNLGVLYKSVGRREDAIRVYEKAIEINPDLADAYYNLGNIYKNEGRNRKAAEYYGKALEKNPYHALAQKKLSEISRK